MRSSALSFPFLARLARIALNTTAIRRRLNTSGTYRSPISILISLGRRRRRRAFKALSCSRPVSCPPSSSSYRVYCHRGSWHMNRCSMRHSSQSTMLLAAQCFVRELEHPDRGGDTPLSSLLTLGPSFALQPPSLKLYIRVRWLLPLLYSLFFLLSFRSSTREPRT